MKTINYKGKTCVKAKVVMLPTERSNMCKLIDLEDNSFEIKSQPNKDAFKNDKSHGFHIQPFELYIITDEKIKEGDWCIVTNVATGNKFIKQHKGVISALSSPRKKILATTDSSLKIKSGKDLMKEYITIDENLNGISLPQPSQAFIEAYCKAGGIDEVLVEVEVKKSVKPYDVYNEETILIKTDSHNTISIHPVEERMYSEEKVKDKIREFFIQVDDTWSEDDCEKWIKENL